VNRRPIIKIEKHLNSIGLLLRSPAFSVAMATSPADFLNGADWAVILFYLGGIIALGSWFGKDQHNTRDYFLGSKDIPWWGIGLSIVAAETSALTIIGVPAMAYATMATWPSCN
jgi:hypothetical protein